MLKNLFSKLAGLQFIFAIVTASINGAISQMDEKIGKFGELIKTFWQILQEFVGIMTDDDPDNAGQLKRLYYTYRWDLLRAVIGILQDIVEEKSREGQFESLTDQKLSAGLVQSTQELIKALEEAEVKKKGLASRTYEPQSFPPPSRS